MKTEEYRVCGKCLEKYNCLWWLSCYI